MRFLIVGLGSIGRRHLKNLRQLGVAQDDIILYRTGKSTLPDIEGYRVISSLASIEDDPPDAALICNPTSLHLETAFPLALMGINLFIEKPVSDRMDGLEDLKYVVEHKELKTLVGYQFRFHPELIKLKADIADMKSKFGVEPRMYHISWGEWLPTMHPYEDFRKGYASRRDLGGGVINTFSHPIDYTRWIFGEPEYVKSIYRNLAVPEVDVETIADIVLSYHNMIGTIHLDYIQRESEHYLKLCYGNWKHINLLAYDRNQLFLDEMQHFLDVLNDKAESICDLDDGIETMKLIERIKRG